MATANRTTYLVDGFNVYHSARDASKDLGSATTKWLDLRGLLASYLPLIGRNAQIKNIYYFTAIATHIDGKHPGTTARHKLYIECLQATGVRIELGRFKLKQVWCGTCKTHRNHYEEKETDVAMSVKLFEIFHNDECDTAVLVTGDTDLAPAIQSAIKMFPAKTVCVAFPYKRKNTELAKLVSTSFRMKKNRYIQHQFPDSLLLPSGRAVRKPSTW